MRKPILFVGIFILFLSINHLVAQPEWVKKAFKSANNINPHKKSKVMVLYDVTEVSISESKTSKIKIKLAYAILTKGGEDYGRLELPVSENTQVDEIEGWLKKPNQDIKELEEENTYTIGDFSGSYEHNESGTFNAILPNTEAGDLVAFEAVVEEDDWTSLFQGFTFQNRQPVLLTKYIITIPENWQLQKAGWNLDNIGYSQNGNIHSWKGQNLPFKEREPLSPSSTYLASRLLLAVFNPKEPSPTQFRSWEMVGNWAANVYRDPAIPTEEISAKAAKLASEDKSFVEKIQAIAQYTQDNIRYVAVEIGKERWHPRPAKKTYSNGYGDCKDKTTLMRAMLTSLDIPSIPVLCNPVNSVDSRLSSPFQFNHCIVAINVKNKTVPKTFKNALVKDWLIFDPTDPSVEIGELPWALQGSKVVLCEHLDSVFYKLPFPESRDYSRSFKLQGNIDNNFNYSADISIVHYGGWAASKRHYMRNSTYKEQVDDWEKSLRRTVPDIVLSQYKTLDAADSLTISFTIKGKEILQKSGDYLIIKPNIFKNFDVPKLTKVERQYPIWYGAPKRVDTDIKWLIPEGWEIDKEQPLIESKIDGASILQSISCNRNLISLQSTYIQYGYLMDRESYPGAKSFSQSLSEVNSYTILLKQKSEDTK